jgi:hypothetical protein
LDPFLIFSRNRFGVRDNRDVATESLISSKDVYPGREHSFMLKM